MPLYRAPSSGGGGAVTRDPWSWRPGNGAAGGRADRVHLAGSLRLGFSAQEYTTAAGTGVAIPYYSDTARTVVNIGTFVNTTTATGSVAFGLYSNNSDADPFPFDLLGTSAAVGLQNFGAASAAVTWALSADTLYWFAFAPSGAAGLRAMSFTNTWDIWGGATNAYATGGNCVTQGSLTGTTLPARWDQTLAPNTLTALPVIGARLSAA